MCICNPSIRTPFCSSQECQEAKKKWESNQSDKGKIYTLEERKDSLMKEQRELEEEIRMIDYEIDQIDEEIEKLKEEK